VTKIVIGLEGSQLELSAAASDLRRFTLTFEQFLEDGSVPPKRFLFRNTESGTVHTIIIDMTKVQWVRVEEQMTQRELKRAVPGDGVAAVRAA
jgi:hypothetical protein